MNKKDYLDLLRYYLRDLPNLVVDDIIYDYNEHFNIGIEKGKSQEEISKELGPPDDIAREYVGGDFNRIASLEAVESLTKEKRKNKILWLILLVLCSPLIFAFLIGFLGLVFGIFVGLTVSGGGFVVGGFGIFASYIPGLEGIVWLPVVHPLTRISLAVLFICLGILLIYLGIKFIKLVWEVSRKVWISIRWKWVRR